MSDMMLVVTDQRLLHIPARTITDNNMHEAGLALCGAIARVEARPKSWAGVWCTKCFDMTHGRVGDLDEAERLQRIVNRQDKAIDVALAALVKLAKRGSISRETREFAIQMLTLARNENFED